MFYLMIHFSVNNIELIKTANINNQKLANQAIKKGYRVPRKNITRGWC